MKKKFPVISLLTLTAIVILSLACSPMMTKDPLYMDLAHCNEAPGKEFLFGTDEMGRDIFSMIWYGGRISLTVGFLAALISTTLAVLVGSVSGCASARIDGVLMRLTELILSVPGLLLTVSLQAVFGRADVYSLSVVIGLTGWMGMAKVVRTEVVQLGNGFCFGGKMSGRPFFSCAVPASGAQPVPVRSVHGSYACEKCHRGGSCAELYGTWSSGGSGFLGQYALAG